MATTKPLSLALQDTGFRLTEGRPIEDAIVFNNGQMSTYGIVAAGTTQATATPLGAPLNQVDTTAANTGVNLPLSTGKRNVAFQNCIIVNNGANTLSVYGAQGSADTINGTAGSTAFTIAAGFTAAFVSIKGGAWFTGDITAAPSGNKGTFVATGSAVTITNANITANSVVEFGLKTVGGTILGAPYMTTVTPGTGFTVNAGASDTSTYNYNIVG